MSAEVLVFDILGAIAILAALGVVLARNPVHSAVSLVVTFVNLAGIYVILRAEFLAAVQIIVYTGAILVLVLFVIMLVHQEDLPDFHGGHRFNADWGSAWVSATRRDCRGDFDSDRSWARPAPGRQSKWRPQAATFRLSGSSSIPATCCRFRLPHSCCSSDDRRAGACSTRSGQGDYGHGSAGLDYLPGSSARRYRRRDLRDSRVATRDVDQARGGRSRARHGQDGDEFTEHPAWGEHRRQ